jgi:hypothetical protein
MLNSGLIIELADEDNVILHGRCEPMTLQGGLPNTLEKHGGEAGVVPIVLDTFYKEGQQVDGSLVHHVALFNGNVIDHVPWILLIINRDILEEPHRKKVTYLEESADETLEWPLRAVLGKRRLERSEYCHMLRMRILNWTGNAGDQTHALRRLNVLHQHNKLLAGNESLESRVINVIRIRGNDGGAGSLPRDILRLGEQLHHEMLLARQLHINMTLAQTTRTTAIPVSLETINGSNSLIEADKLDIAVKSLARDALHDDVDGLVIILGDDLCVTTEECKDLRAIDRVRNLQIISTSFTAIPSYLRF